MIYLVQAALLLSTMPSSIVGEEVITPNRLFEAVNVILSLQVTYITSTFLSFAG